MPASIALSTMLPNRPYRSALLIKPRRGRIKAAAGRLYAVPLLFYRSEKIYII